MKLLNPWAHARRLAEQTPERRNRHVDFMRAVSIGFVVIGHWLAAVVFIDEGELRYAHILNAAPWADWLSWIFQVMPVFFIVGGYANAASWESAGRKGQAFELWIAIRLRRLVRPIMPLLAFWCVIALLADQIGFDPQLIQFASQVALTPLWFLAVYLVLVLMTPITSGLWRRYGVHSFWGFALMAMAVDIISFTADIPLLRWANYGFVWLAVFQLGYIWRAGGIAGPARTLWWAAGGLLVTMFLVMVASYPVSMVSEPGAELSNSRPPTIALLALAVMQFGLLRAIERPARSWLQRSTPWTATVLTNATIMTVFLWHLTALIVVVSLAYKLGGYGIHWQPFTVPWWVSRPIWIMVLILVLLVFVVAFARFEYKAKVGPARPLAIWKAIGGTVMLCSGFALLALEGIGGEGLLDIQLFALLLVLIGGGLLIGKDIISKRGGKPSTNIQ